MNDYADFIARKMTRTPATGFEPAPLTMGLFPFQRDLVTWACRQGRAAIFADCGLGKSRMALEWARQVQALTLKPVLILTPLAVAPQFVTEGAAMGLAYDVCHWRAPSDAGHIMVANYDRLHQLSDLTPHIGGIVLDESSILKSFDGKTRTELIERFATVPYKLCCTATPAPNDYTEVGNHSEFLNVMRRVDMLNRFFEHSGENTSEWHLKGHARKPFWRWVASWARSLAMPSDMGYQDDGYDLPPMSIVEHIIPTTAEQTRASGLLLGYQARTLAEQRTARRGSLDARVAVAANIVEQDPAEQWIVWCELNDESSALTTAIPGSVEIRGSDSFEAKESAIARFIYGDLRVLVTKPSICGWGLNLQRCARQVFVGLSHSFEQFHQATRRLHRFGQLREVHTHIVVAEAEGAVRDSIMRKQREFHLMRQGLIDAMRDPS